jgi:DNA end-binding protein Ku
MRLKLSRGHGSPDHHSRVDDHGTGNLEGAISFGLVHIPVALVSATSSQGVDFDWLDSRSMDPVGYKRVNKVTGKEVTKEHIVKGIQFEKGRYVVLSEEDIRSAHPLSTQTIDIFAFVDSDQIPLQNIDTPYYLAPDKRGGKVYALLRETLTQTQKVALAWCCTPANIWPRSCRWNRPSC